MATYRKDPAPRAPRRYNADWFSVVGVMLAGFLCVGMVFIIFGVLEA